MKFFIIFLLLTFSFGYSQSQAPTGISNLKLWYSADSVHLSSGKIDTLYDLSGNGNNAVQSDANLQPSLITNNIEINQKPAIHFGKGGNSGDQTVLSFSQVAIPSNSLTLIVLYKKLTTNNALNYMFTDVGKGMSAGGTAYVNTLIFDGSSFIEESVGPATYSYIQFNNNIVYRNGTVSPSMGGIGAIAFNTIGARADAHSLFYHGEIVEIILYDRIISATERSLLDNYLNNKYAPPVQLPNDISITNSVCDTTLAIINPNNNQFTNFLWPTGATTPSISVNKSGKYWVNATNIFGRISSDTIIVNYPNYSFKDSLFCPNNSIIWNTNLDKNQFSFLWSDGSTDSLLTINQSGQYHVKITDGFGCIVQSDTITATVDNFSTIASLGPDTNLCAGNAIYLKAGNQAGLTYSWNDGSSNDSLYINTTGQYSVTITNSNSCVAKDTINVTVVGQAPTVSFLNSVTCKNNAVTFTDNSSPPSGNSISSWFWNFGDGTTLADTSLLQNPFYLYTDTGNYQISLLVTTNAGCKQSFSKNIHVAPKPVANFSNILACQNDSALFSNLSTSIAGYTPLTYQWNFGDPASGTANTSSLANPKHLFSQQLNYPVKLITTNNAGCKDSLTKNILVKAEVTADFVYSTPCVKSPVNFQDNSTVPAPDNLNTRLWTIGTSTITGLSTSRTFTAAGIYSVSLKVTGYNGCVSTITKPIDVKWPPVPQFSLNSICYKDTAHILDQSLPQNGSISSWTWKLDNITFSSVQNPTLSPSATTNYSVKLIVSNSFNCIDSLSKAFSVYPLPAVDFTTNPGTYYYPNTPVVFSPSNTGSTVYDWSINSTTYTIITPTVTFPAPGTYTASLGIKNTFGCANTKTKTLNVLGYLVDLAILEIRAIKSSDNYISVEVDLGNTGTAAISNFEINYQIPDAATIKESWSGLLNPGAFLTFTFNSKAIQKDPSEDFITCVNLGLVNYIQDFNQNNNNLCTPSNLSEITVYDPYPNPSEENTTLSIILPTDIDIHLDVVDELGQTVFNDQVVSGKQGLNLVTIPTEDLSKATYMVKITIADKVFIKKFLKAKQ